MTKQKLLHPLVTLAFGALCISFAPVFVKMLGFDILGPTAIAFWRTFFGATILLLLALVRGESLKLPGKVFKLAILAGLFFCFDLFVWHRSILFSGAGIATILGNTQVFWLALIGVVLFKEKISVSFLGAVLAAFVGVVLLVGVGSFETFDSRYISGIVFGLMTGIFYSCYTTTLKTAGHNEVSFGFISLMAYTSFFCAIFLGISTVIESAPAIPPDLYSWLVLIALALVAQALGWWMISRSLPQLDASKSGMVLLLQPTLATVWGALFFAERLSLLQICGAALTLAAIYFGSVWKAKKK